MYSLPPYFSGLQNNVSRTLGNNPGLNSSVQPPPTKPPGVILPEGVSLPPTTGQVQARPKANKVKPAPSSKIPLSAVELPDDVIGGINLQMTGLQFGFDFLNDTNKAPSMPESKPYSATSSYANAPPSG